MSRQLTLSGKVAARWKVYGKPTKNCKQFVNAFLADECRCSPSLPLQQAKKMTEAAWKATDHGTDEVVVSNVLSSSTNDDECVMISFIVPVPKFPSNAKFPSDVLTLKYILLFLRQRTPVFWCQKESVIGVQMGEGGWGGGEGVTPMWKTLRSGNKCELMSWPLRRCLAYHVLGEFTSNSQKDQTFSLSTLTGKIE